MLSDKLFPYKWYLKGGYPAKGIEKHGLTAFGTFICGGGSSMGYKLAGYNHLGGVEIDTKMSELYQKNHNPKYLFTEDIRAFNKRDDLPEELYNLDLLDGSPPCSSFSLAGVRERDWGKQKKFAEGQALQTLDDLVFVYCDAILKLRPKVAILENVKGLIQGNAKPYANKIIAKLEAGGYDVQLFLLDASLLGVPQKRERVFFIARRKDLSLPPLKIEYLNKRITWREVLDCVPKEGDIAPAFSDLYIGYKMMATKTVGKFSSGYGVQKLHLPASTVVAGGAQPLPHPYKSRPISKNENILIQSFPLDYDFGTFKKYWYVLGMSVPPVMMANLSYQIYKQLLSKS